MPGMEEMFFESDSNEESSFDLNRYIQAILKRKWLILAIVLGVSIPWLLYLKSLPPTYEASCQIRFRNLEREGEAAISDDRITELKSRSFAERVVAQLGLTLSMEKGKNNIHRRKLFEEFTSTQNPEAGDYVFRWQDDGTYKIMRKIEDREILIDEGALLQAQMASRSTNAGFTFRLTSDFSNLPHEINFKIVQFRRAVESFQNRTEITVLGGNILKLTMTDHDPVLAAQMVNRLADIYVLESRSLKKKSADAKKNIIKERLEHAREELEQAKEELRAFKSTHFVSLDTETRAQMDEKNRIETELSAYQNARDAIRTLLDKIISIGNSIESQKDLKYVYIQLANLPTFETNPRMGFLKEELADLERQYEEGVRTYTERHESVIAISQKIAQSRNKVKQEAESHMDNLNSKIAQLSSRLASLEFKLKQQLPADQLRLQELEDQYKAKTELYNQLYSQFQLAELQQVAETENVDILDPALIPDYPVNRDKKKKAAMGILFSLALGVGIALAIDFFDKSIKTVDDVKKFLKLEVLGAIPSIDFKDLNDYQDSEKIKQIDQQLVTYDYSPTPIGEAYRSLRTNLVFSKQTGRIHSFVITSTAPGDGKSFTAANVAISMAQHKSNTLIIDADLRRGVLHNTFGVPKEPGLTNYLTGMVSFQHIINETLTPNLSMISCGSLLPNPSELLGSPQMKRFLDEARRKFDIIIFDSPPLNAATDAIVIGTQVDAVVLVIRAGVTDRNLAKQKLEMFKNVPVRLLGVVLNGTHAEFGHDGYSYYHY
ncbi:MAG: polysaccharide biosynthesis tyrosine autokinase [candidate division KSB1 bacterium]|nr:polysaccharide biosynthesis tyrosine autokinase [candidate division KSB1 bacterium]MDZ7334017.1 polysaccharide biosynthesis tyrosine autokinase [candidate division KSB1 bacterium]MDZ7357452.1 polysaccharide biosynthesis tyrosine autokinase [candidate division KSB1 bacterium]MDZ7375112.1 polysaccharide biosynthesis tyrosine autokinase [candidate division KSB1 bacterium]MDZ7400002.1 polysaccharide biosynthesis tyrosine autokinase [candidate division KSB1 bacterium]